MSKVFTLFILLLLCGCTDRTNKETREMRVPPAVYSRDKKTIEDAYMSNLSFMMMYHYVDSLEDDPAWFYRVYSIIHDPVYSDDIEYAKKVASKYYKVVVDTIIYNSSLSQYFAFCGIGEKDTITNKYLWDARAVVGHRRRADGQLSVYPFPWASVCDFKDYRDALDYLESCYMKYIKGRTLSETICVRSDWKSKIKMNLGEDGFFEDSGIFDLYDDTTYNFQLYYYRAKIHRYRYPYGHN